MYTLGLTGGSGAGKGYVSAIFESYGIHSLDTDKVSRQVCMPGEPCLGELAAEFGQGIIRADGTLDRRALGSIVFASPERRAKLNAILHPMILGEIRRQLHAQNAAGHIVFGDIPLLFECGMEKDFDAIWVVSASRETQIARLFERDGLSREEAEKRIDSQMPLSEKEKRASAVIRTEGTIENTQAQVRALLDHLEKRRQA